MVSLSRFPLSSLCSHNPSPVVSRHLWCFPSWAASRLSEGDVLSLLDPRLGGDAGMEELGRVWTVAFWCIQDDESYRPTMGPVVQILEGVAEVNIPPVPRSLQLLGDIPTESIVFFSHGGGSQVTSSNISSSISQYKSTTSTSSMD